MPRYKFKINGLEHRAVDALDLEDALERAGITKDEPYEPLEADAFDEKWMSSAITDEILFGL